MDFLCFWAEVSPVIMFLAMIAVGVVAIVFVAAIIAAIYTFIKSNSGSTPEEKKYRAQISNDEDDSDEEGEEQDFEEEDLEDGFFEVIGEYDDYDIVRCKPTNVLYIKSTDYHGPSTFTLLVNPDGTPMLYNAELWS